jgi:hypothetical protein
MHAHTLQYRVGSHYGVALRNLRVLMAFCMSCGNSVMLLKLAALEATAAATDTSDQKQQ